MSALSQVKKISQKHSVSTEEFIRSSVITNLKEQQRLLQIERFKILAGYQASNEEELNHRITEGSAPKQPAWAHHHNIDPEYSEQTIEKELSKWH
ncbi:MAG: hypothetical protein JJV89_04820 [Desulfosarcina sp.]|nr:hypothetical protein [Desulfobacterales bacterium]